MGTILYSRNRLNEYTNSALEKKILGIIIEEPQEILKQLFGKYKIYSYKSINNPLNYECIIKPVPGIQILSIYTPQSFTHKLNTILPSLTNFEETKIYTTNNLIECVVRMIKNNLIDDISEPTKLKSKPEDMKSTPIEIDYTKEECPKKNYLLVRDNPKKYNPNLEKKLVNILEIATIMLNITTIDKLKEQYITFNKL